MRLNLRRCGSCTAELPIAWVQLSLKGILSRFTLILFPSNSAASQIFHLGRDPFNHWRIRFCSVCLDKV
jgi:hypothetical protein